MIIDVNFSDSDVDILDDDCESGAVDVEVTEDEETFSVELVEEDSTFLVEMEEPTGEGGTSDHDKLANRGAADQHPMSAITGLEDALAGKQPKGNYLPADTKIPSKTSDLSNDSGFITKLANDLANYYRKDETLTAEEINQRISAIPRFSIKVVADLPTEDISDTTVYLIGGGTGENLYTEYIHVNGAWELLGAQRVDLTGYATEEWVIGRLTDYALKDDVPTKTSDLTNDSNFATEQFVEKAISEIPTPDVSGQISAHNVDPGSHNDIRLLISGLSERINALADSDDTTLDQMSEVVAYIKDNRELIEQVTTAKISVSDIIDNLTTNVSDRPLSAAQGVVLKQLVDSLTTAVGGKLDASALTDAINTALAQAKESGEFDGEPGAPGEPGYTPQKYVDYWTDADKQEMVAETVDALPVYEGENEESGEASGGGTATGGITVYTNPTEPVPIKNGSQIVFYVNKTGTVTIKIGSATHAVSFSDITKAEWFIWLQSSDAGGSLISPSGTRKWMASGEMAENILLSYDGTGDLIVGVLE